MDKWIVVRVSEEFHTALKRACVDARLTMSEVVRRLSAEWMKEEKADRDIIEGKGDSHV